MDEKQYAIKCGVCGTEFYILDEKCPNCQAEGLVFKYLSQNKNIKRLKLFSAAIYSIPSAFMSIFLYSLSIVIIIFPIYLFHLLSSWLFIEWVLGCLFLSLMFIFVIILINTGYHPFTGITLCYPEYNLLARDYLAVKIGRENYYLINFLALAVIFTTVCVIVFLNEFIKTKFHFVYEYRDKILNKFYDFSDICFEFITIITLPFVHFRYRINKNNKIMLYKTAYDLIQAIDLQNFCHSSWDTSNMYSKLKVDIYKKFTFSAQEYLSEIEEEMTEITELSHNKFYKNNESGKINNVINLELALSLVGKDHTLESRATFIICNILAGISILLSLADLYRFL